MSQKPEGYDEEELRRAKDAFPGLFKDKPLPPSATHDEDKFVGRGRLSLAQRIENMFSFLYTAPKGDLCHFDKTFLDEVKAAAIRGASTVSEIEPHRNTKAGEWLPLLEMFSDKEVLLHGAAGEDAMNVGDVHALVSELARLQASVPSAADLDLRAMGDMILLCGEDECRDVQGYAAKLRSLIDGLIVAKRSAVSATPAKSFEFSDNDIENAKLARQMGRSFVVLSVTVDVILGPETTSRG